jgi:hypothetical protein
MTIEWRVRLWAAINAYAAACGGDPSTPRTAREEAVVALEKEIRRAQAHAVRIVWGDLQVDLTGRLHRLTHWLEEWSDAIESGDRLL